MVPTKLPFRLALKLRSALKDLYCFRPACLGVVLLGPCAQRAHDRQQLEPLLGQAVNRRWVPPGRAEAGLTYRFCSQYGIRLYATGELEQLDGRIYAIHVPTVDDMEREELVHAPLNYVDNAHDRPDRRPADIRLM